MPITPSNLHQIASFLLQTTTINTLNRLTHGYLQLPAGLAIHRCRLSVLSGILYLRVLSAGAKDDRYRVLVSEIPRVFIRE